MASSCFDKQHSSHVSDWSSPRSELGGHICYFALMVSSCFDKQNCSHVSDLHTPRRILGGFFCLLCLLALNYQLAYAQRAVATVGSAMTRKMKAHVGLLPFVDISLPSQCEFSAGTLIPHMADEDDLKDIPQKVEGKDFLITRF